MGKLVVNAAMISCSQALVPTPVPLTITPNMKSSGQQPIATVMDIKPTANIPTFGACNSSTNPAVIAATSAALGVHTPAPCVPATTLPWSPGSPKVTVGPAGFKALTDDSTCKCMWQGTISIKKAGQETVDA